MNLLVLWRFGVAVFGSFEGGLKGFGEAFVGGSEAALWLPGRLLGSPGAALEGLWAAS